MKILCLSIIDVGLTTLHLPLPTMQNTSYLILINGKLSPAYSPIDLAVAGMGELLKENPQKIMNLNNWFNNNPKPLSLIWVFCSVLFPPIETHSILEWKYITERNKKLNDLFIHNSPFTFRR